MPGSIAAYQLHEAPGKAAPPLFPLVGSEWSRLKHVVLRLGVTIADLSLVRPQSERGQELLAYSVPIFQGACLSRKLRSETSIFLRKNVGDRCAALWRGGSGQRGGLVWVEN